MHKSFWTVFIALSSVLLCLFWPIGSAPGSHSVRAQNTRTLQQPWQCTDSDIEKFCITARLGHTTEHLMATFLFYIHIYMQKYKEPEINQSRPGWVLFFHTSRLSFCNPSAVHRSKVSGLIFENRLPQCASTSVNVLNRPAAWCVSYLNVAGKVDCYSGNSAEHYSYFFPSWYWFQYLGCIYY